MGWLGYCFFFFSYPDFSPNIDNIYIILGLSRIPVKKITAIALGEEVEKKQNKERLSEHDETSIKFLEEAINCIPLAIEDGADFENAAFIFNLQPGSLLL